MTDDGLPHAQLGASWRANRPRPAGRHLDSAASSRQSTRALDAAAHHARHEAELGGYVAEAASDDLVALDESLSRLENQDPAAAKLVKLRYFAGMSVSEAAEALGVSLRTAERNWTYARTWLRRDLS